MAFSTEWIRTGSLCIFIYVFINILLYHILTICTHEHYPIGSSWPQTQVYEPLFPAFFSQFLDFSLLVNNTFAYMIKGPCVFSVLPIWAFINNAKHRHFDVSDSVSATDSYGEKSLPALQLHFDTPFFPTRLSVSQVCQVWVDWYIQIEKVILNCNNISQYYYFYGTLII